MYRLKEPKRGWKLRLYVTDTKMNYLVPMLKTIIKPLQSGTLGANAIFLPFVDESVICIYLSRYVHSVVHHKSSPNQVKK